MKVAMDRSGRIVIPQSIRERLGLVPGAVDLIIDGTGLRIEVECPDNVVEDEDGQLIITGGPALTPEEIRELRLVDQR